MVVNIQFLGGKARLGRAIAKILESLRPEGAQFLEPFMGTCNVTIHMSGGRLCSDVNEDIVELMRAVRDGWDPPEVVTEEEYAACVRGEVTDPKLRAFIGYGCSWSGGWLKGYARSKKQPNYAATARRSLLRKAKLLEGVVFRSCDYRVLQPNRCLIYCDPPYVSNSIYRKGDRLASFDHGVFWETMRRWSARNVVVVSEYVAPPDWECIAEFPGRLNVQNASASKERVERLFKKLSARCGDS